MREFREYGSARGALSNERPYRDPIEMRYLVNRNIHATIAAH
jgi:hypothetical protein